MKNSIEGIPDQPCADGSLPVLTETLSPLAQAQEAVKAAQTARDEVELRFKAAERDAQAVVAEQFRAERQAALSRLAEARRQLTAAMDEQPAHPWTGKRVFKMESSGRGWARTTAKQTRVEGVVETRRSTTAFPANSSLYSLPGLGDGFVRLLKSDGTPGARFDRLSTYSGWKLVEGDQ